MAEKYYTIVRKDKLRYRKKLLSVLRKNGYSDADILRIVDSVAGRTHLGKEAAAKEILDMIAKGAQRQDVLAHIDAYGVSKFAFADHTKT